jgi:MoaA/NifB/PqqE/SkfB family radical SAM enzyme
MIARRRKGPVLSTRLLKRENYRKLWALFRDHRLAQTLNTLHFSYHALTGFRSPVLDYQPPWLILFITLRCNLRCRQCLFKSPQSPNPRSFSSEMTPGFLREILDRYSRAMSLSFAGGEPFLHEDILGLIRVAHERRVKVHINTNGTALAGREEIIASWPLVYLNFSLYGADAESFSRTTGAPTSLFEEVLGSAEDIVRCKRRSRRPCILSASFVCNRGNLEEAVEIVRLCERIGFDQVILRNLGCFGIPGYEEQMCLYENDPQTSAFLREIRRGRFRIPIFIPRLYRTEYRKRRCEHPFRSLVLDGDGFTAPCCVEGPDRRWDNFHDQKDIWNSKTMADIRRKLLDPSCSLLFQCGHCEWMLGDPIKMV